MAFGWGRRHISPQRYKIAYRKSSSECQAQAVELRCPGWASVSPNVLQSQLGVDISLWEGFSHTGEARPPSVLAQEGKEQATETVQE